MQEFLLHGAPEVQIWLHEWAKKRGLKLRYAFHDKSEYNQQFCIVTFRTLVEELRYTEELLAVWESSPSIRYRRFDVSRGQHPFYTISYEVPVEYEMILG